jgi:hypothetical protein
MEIKEHSDLFLELKHTKSCTVNNHRTDFCYCYIYSSSFTLLVVYSLGSSAITKEQRNHVELRTHCCGFSSVGFEAGATNTSNIDPWTVIGDESSIYLKTEKASCFSKNIMALRMEVLCDECPGGSVGIYNPGFWGMVRSLFQCISGLEHEYENINHKTIIQSIVYTLQYCQLKIERKCSFSLLK